MLVFIRHCIGRKSFSQGTSRFYFITMPWNRKENSPRYKRLVCIPRSTLGRPKGYGYKFETRDVACKRISDQTSRLSAAFNREADVKLLHELDRINKESRVSLGRMQVDIDKTRTFLIDTTSYRIFLRENIKEPKPPTPTKSVAQAPLGVGGSDCHNTSDGHSPDKFGRYGDVYVENSQPDIKATKLLHFDGSTKRKMEAQRLLSRRDTMACLPHTAGDTKLFSLAEGLVSRDRKPGEKVTDYHLLSDIISRLKRRKTGERRTQYV